MGYKIDEVEGIGPAYAEKLQGAGIDNTDDLLEKCGGKSGRGNIAEATGISEKLILTWTNQADLMRISGVGPQFAELLQAAGVDTVKELRNRNAENLAAKLIETNEAKNLTNATISEKTVQGFVEKAGELDPCITH